MSGRPQNLSVSPSPPSVFSPRIDQEERREEHVVLEEQLYFNSQETNDVKVLGGRVTYSLHSKYLGSLLSYNLRDDYDISNRILQANIVFWSHERIL